MSIAWKLTLKGVDITQYVASFSLQGSLGEFCHQINVTFGINTVLDSYNWNKIRKTPDVELYLDDGSTGFVKYGTFFVEKPAYVYEKNRAGLSGFWGRSIHAVFAYPFSPKLSKKFMKDLTINDLIRFIYATYGQGYFTHTDLLNTYGNYVLKEGDFGLEESYPIDFLSNLMDICGGRLVPCFDGTFKFMRTYKNTYLPASVLTLTDADIAGSGCAIDVPEFGNRVKITGTIGTGSSSFQFWSKNVVCWSESDVEAHATKKIVGQVTDAKRVPMDGLSVHWKFKESDSVVEEHATLQYNTTITKLLSPITEVVTASSFREVALSFVPLEIFSIKYWHSTENINYAPNAFIEGNRVTLARDLPTCDAKVVVTYSASGIVTQRVTSTGVVGDNTLIASVGGVGKAKQDYEIALHFYNTCACDLGVNFMTGGIIDPSFRTYEDVSVENQLVTIVGRNGIGDGPSVTFAGYGIEVTNVSLCSVYQNRETCFNILNRVEYQGNKAIAYVNSEIPPTIGQQSFVARASYSYKKVTIAPKEANNTLLIGASEVRPFYVMATQEGKPLNNRKIELRIMDGSEFIALSTGEVITQEYTIEETSDVSEIRIGEYACSVKNVPNSVLAVYLYNDNTGVDYSRNYFLSWDSEVPEIIFVSSDVNRKKVVVQYKVYCGLFYVAALNTTQFIVNEKATLRARVYSRKEAPTEDFMDIAIENPFPKRKTEIESHTSVGCTNVFHFLEDDDNPEQKIVNNQGFSLLGQGMITKYQSQTPQKIVLRDNVSMMGPSGISGGSNSDIVGPASFSYSNETKKFHPEGVMLKDSTA